MDLVILVCSDGSKLRFWEKKGPKVVPVQIIDVIRLHHMKARLVFVHAVHYDLQKNRERNETLTMVTGGTSIIATTVVNTARRY